MSNLVYLNKDEILYIEEIQESGKEFYRPIKKYSKGDQRDIVTKVLGIFKKTKKEYVSEDLYIFRQKLYTMSELKEHILSNYSVYLDEKTQVFYYEPQISVHFKQNRRAMYLTFYNEEDMNDFFKKYGLWDSIIKDKE